ncbi:MAG: excinuclease ABC subunit UvrC [Acidobacteria bacterium]|nr:excinuclease ABC subunit UvrC [Acidobacteriota bacterium]
MMTAEQLANIPTGPGVYQFKNTAGEVIYVGKAKNLRARVRSYFLEARLAEAKTDTLVREADSVSTIIVDNEREALALENNLIKQLQPRYNILLRDDKTYPYIKLTVAEKYPRVYVTRRLKKDGSLYFGPYFPGNLAHRLSSFIHRTFLVPSCTVDLTRTHARPCLQFHIHRCQGPCVAGLTTDELYAEAVADVKLFLEGRNHDLAQMLKRRMADAAEHERFEEAAACRDLLTTVEDHADRQKMAATEGEEIDIFGYHREGPLVAVNIFHTRYGRVLDRREFFWESQHDFDAPEFFSSLLKQLYLDARYIPAILHVPVDFEDREPLEELLGERRSAETGRKTSVEIHTPQRGPKRAMMELAERNAALSFEQRFRILQPSAKMIAEGLQEALDLPEPPARIECFDISHIQGSDTVASMVVWADGKMQKGEYRKFIVKTVAGIDDFASMREVVGRRYRRLQEEAAQKPAREDATPFPSLVLIDGGIGQLHAAAAALEELGIINQPLASIAKREEILYVLGHEHEPVRLDHHSPVLRLVQQIRDESHRFAVKFHRQRRDSRQLRSELLDIPGIGPATARKLLEHFGSIENLRRATPEDLEQVLTKAQSAALCHALASQAN